MTFVYKSLPPLLKKIREETPRCLLGRVQKGPVLFFDVFYWIHVQNWYGSWVKDCSGSTSWIDLDLIFSPRSRDRTGLDPGQNWSGSKSRSAFLIFSSMVWLKVPALFLCFFNALTDCRLISSPVLKMSFGEYRKRSEF